MSAPLFMFRRAVRSSAEVANNNTSSYFTRHSYFTRPRITLWPSKVLHQSISHNRFRSYL